jgi:hypothetical protein
MLLRQKFLLLLIGLNFGCINGCAPNQPASVDEDAKYSQNDVGSSTTDGPHFILIIECFTEVKNETK